MSTSTARPEPNLTRNGPELPTGELWPRDGSYPTDRNVRAWLQGRDVDGWVVEIAIDWLDGSPPERYAFDLEGCGPHRDDRSEDPFPASNPGESIVAVEHSYEERTPRRYGAAVTVTSVSCAGDEPQAATAELAWGEIG
jgi:hypothetical protein